MRMWPPGVSWYSRDSCQQMTLAAAHRDRHRPSVGLGDPDYGDGDPQTPPPVPHTITYFCGTASGDFVDAQNPGTGRLDGAVNRSYNLGSGTDGHQAIKESQAVFNDFLPLLNSVPPAPAVTLGLTPDAGEYPAPLTVTVSVDPTDVQVHLGAAG